MNTFRPFYWLSTLAAFAVATNALGQGATGFLDVLKDAGVEIRKSFTGSAKDAGNPASISYENPDSGRDFYSIDLGVKAGTYFEDALSKGSWASRLAPTFEIHRSTKENEDTRKLGGGITLEIDRAFGPKEDLFGAMLFTDLKFEMNRDSVLDETTRTTTLRAGWYDTTRSWGPGKWIGETSATSFRWMPTIGVEDFVKLPIKTKVNGASVVVAEAADTTVAFLRLNIVLMPFRSSLDGKLALTATQTLRSHIGGDDTYGSSTHLFEGSLDYYLDSKNRLAFGFSYQTGRDPNRNFLDEEFSSVGLKLKLSP